MIPPYTSPQRTLQALVQHLETRCIEKWERVPGDAALFVRRTDRGGYELRMTERLHPIVTWDFANTYVEGCNPPRGWDTWSQRLGGDHWADRLGIRPAGW